MIYMLHDLRLHGPYMFANPKHSQIHGDIIWHHDQPQEDQEDQGGEVLDDYVHEYLCTKDMIYLKP